MPVNKKEPEHSDEGAAGALAKLEAAVDAASEKINIAASGPRNKPQATAKKRRRQIVRASRRANR